MPLMNQGYSMLSGPGGDAGTEIADHFHLPARTSINTRLFVMSTGSMTSVDLMPQSWSIAGQNGLQFRRLVRELF